MDMPRLGSIWEHRNGNKYKVIALANTRTMRPEEYPITVIYENIVSKEVWCKKASDWERSMNEINMQWNIGIRQIKNNFIRRTLMIVLFVPVICLTATYNAFRYCAHFALSVVKSVAILAGSVKEFWKSPETKK